MNAGTSVALTSPSIPAVTVRLARLGDVPGLTRMYLGLGPYARGNYHPFPFNRFSAGASYLIVVAGQTLFRWAMRRIPTLLALVVVVTVDGRPGIAGSVTYRGERAADGELIVRNGLCVAEGFRGARVGRRMVAGAAEIVQSFGIRRGTGTIFADDPKLVAFHRSVGYRLEPSRWVDPKAPHRPVLNTPFDPQILVKTVRGQISPSTDLRVEPA